MYRLLGLFLCLVLMTSVPFFASAEEAVHISFPGVTVEYTPEGYYPKADAGAYSGALRYEVTDNADSSVVTLPIRQVGTYTVQAFLDGTSTHGAATAIATVTVVPARAYIRVTDNVVAHTSLENPVKYSILPVWAEEKITVSLDYRAISSLSDSGTWVQSPKDIGKYLVYLDAVSNDPNVECSDKYLIYEIAESKGATLTEKEAIATVPSQFRAEVENVNAVYNKEPVVPQYSFNVAGVECKLMYSYLRSDGSLGEYTDTPPTEPGDYVAACFVLGQNVGSGKIVISKKSAEIKMEDCTYTYTPEGVYPPAATVVPQGIDVTYNAYKYVDGVATESVELPLIDCGTYLISACPGDIAHYNYTVSYCYLTIEKATPVISGEDLEVTEDGEEKSALFTVSPDYVEYEVSYYSLIDGVAVPISGKPSAAGDYYAAVSVKSGDRFNSVTKAFGVRITPYVDKHAVATPVLLGLCYLFSFFGVALGVFHILWVKRFGKV